MYRIISGSPFPRDRLPGSAVSAGIVNFLFSGCVETIYEVRVSGAEVPAMRRFLVPGLVGVLVLILAGCGGGSGTDLTVFEQLSDQAVDAHISAVIDPGTGEPTIFPASVSGSIRVGVDGTGIEYRGFMDFPISGIPAAADVRLAYIELFVGSVPFGGAVPVLVELVDFQPPTLIGSDFFYEAPAPFLPPVLARPIFDFFPSDAVIPRPAVRIEVTTLVQRALQRLQPDFQLRLLLDPAVPGPGIVQLDDGAAATAPLLHVEYL